MKKFTFRLQVVLDLAVKEEERQLQRLGEVAQRRVAKEGQIGQCHTDRQQALQMTADLQQGTFDPLEAHRMHLHLETLAARLAELRGERAAIVEEQARVQQDVMAAMRKRQLLEKLRDTKQAQHRKEMETVELRTMEESMLPRLARERAVEEARWELVHRAEETKE